MAEESASEPALERDALISEIIGLEADCAALRERLERHSEGKKRKISRTRKALGLLILGRKLTVCLGDFLAKTRHSPREFMGPELARTLDALSLRLIGRKRWITIVALIAAVPGAISVWLLFEQNRLTDQERIGATVTAGMQNRSDLLMTIYATVDNPELVSAVKPLYSARSRREAVLALIPYDRSLMESRSDATEAPGLGKMVDISIAPLGGIDFTPREGEPPYHLDRIGFSGCHFNDASFAGLRVTNCFLDDGHYHRTSFRGTTLENCWLEDSRLIGADFREATLTGIRFGRAKISGVDFRGAAIEGCDFTGAVYTPDVRWPEGFEPGDFGATEVPQLEPEDLIE